MVAVVFRDEVGSKSPNAALGVLAIPESEAIGSYMGMRVQLSIEVDSGDFPIGPYTEGIFGEPGTGIWYDYRVENIDDSKQKLPRSGRLVIVGMAKRTPPTSE